MPIRFTPAVKAISIICFVAFLVQQSVDQFMGGNLLAFFGLVPAKLILQLHFWQLFTYPFFHTDVLHLFLNLMMIVFIGADLEAMWGTKRFVLFFFVCSTVAGIAYLLLQVFTNTMAMPMVGSSGAVYGMLMAYGLIFAERQLLFMMLFPMKAKHFIWVLAAMEFMTTVFNGRGGLASIAHLAGMATGFAYIWIQAGVALAQKRRIQGALQQAQDWTTKPQTAAKPGLFGSSKKSASHLKLVKNADPLKKDPPPGGKPPVWH